MDAAFPDGMIRGFESFVASLRLPDPGDRHVLAAAMVGRADLIVTRNPRDFPYDYLAPHGLEALDPDTVVEELLDLNPDRVFHAARMRRFALTRPGKSTGEFLTTQERHGLSNSVEIPRRLHAEDPDRFPL